MDFSVDRSLVKKNLNDISDIKESPIRKKSEARHVEDQNGANGSSLNANKAPENEEFNIVLPLDTSSD